MSYTVRTVRSDEWERLRSIRLEALADAPEAFITTLAEATAFADDLWIERARAGAAGDTQVTVIAVSEADTVGLAVGLWDPERSGSVMPVVSVFVAPRARRCGLGSAMMDAVHAWGRGKGATSSSLWVVDGNDSARRFYEGLGYRRTLDRHRITVPPVRWETRMTLQLR